MTHKGSTTKPRFIIWSQHYLGYKPKKFDVAVSREGADAKAKTLNASPSGEWFRYYVEDSAPAGEGTQEGAR